MSLEFTSEAKSEFRRTYIPETKAAVQEEAQELIRVSILQTQTHPMKGSGSISFETEDDGTHVFARATGTPELVRYFSAIFRAIPDWRQKKEVKVLSAVAVRPIARRSNAAYAAEARAAANSSRHPITAVAPTAVGAAGNAPAAHGEKAFVIPKAAEKARLTEISESRGLPLLVVNSALRLSRSQYKELMRRGVSAAEADRQATALFEAALR